MNKLVAALRDSARREQILRWAYWTLPPLFCLAVYFYGLRAWYQQDDFVWLGQRFRIHSFEDFLRAVFGPSQHGTFRPLSERLFFLVTGTLFGSDAVPARAIVFVTQIANLFLLSAIARRLSGSRIAGFLAPVLWTANSALAFPMSWTSAYMQILCGFCLLVAFYFFLRYVETGERRFYYWQWAVFLVGFGVMESTIVYPAVAAAYAVLFARRHLKSVLPLFAGSALFFVFHTLYVPKQKSGVYSLHFDLSVFSTVATYWRWVLVPANWTDWTEWPAWTARLLAGVLTVALLAYVVAAARRNYLPVFGLVWFILLLAPVLPLKEHMEAYYLTLPSLGIALTGAFAAASAANRTGWRRAAAGFLVLLFLTVQAPIAHASTKWWYLQSKRVQTIMHAVAAVRQMLPGQTIVLTGVDRDVFVGIFWDDGFRALGLNGIYIDPGEREKLMELIRDESIESRFLDRSEFYQGLSQDRIRVLSVAGTFPLDVTPRFQAQAKASGPAWPRRVNAGTPLAATYLRGQWYELETDHRWMGKTAGVLLAGPRNMEEKLVLSGYCVEAQTAAGPLVGTILVDGKPTGTFTLTKGGAPFEAIVPLPPETVGKDFIEVRIELNKTFRPEGDIRELGLSFGTFQIR